MKQLADDVHMLKGFDPEAVFRACVRYEKAIEINSRPERLDPPPSALDRRLLGWAASR